MGTGSDISYSGRLGNFTDNDWVVNTGIRGQGLRPRRSSAPGRPSTCPAASTARSSWRATSTPTASPSARACPCVHGDDRVRLPGRGVLVPGRRSRLRHSDDAMQWSHGYTGMKAKQVGGMRSPTASSAWHPTAYVGWGGMNDTRRTTSSRGRRARGWSTPAIYEGLPGPHLGFGADYWFLQDTGLTFVDFDQPRQHRPALRLQPRGVRAPRSAWARCSGHEIDLEVIAGRSATSNTDRGALRELGGAIFLPGGVLRDPIWPASPATAELSSSGGNQATAGPERRHPGGDASEPPGTSTPR